MKLESIIIYCNSLMLASDAHVNYDVAKLDRIISYLTYSL